MRVQGRAGRGRAGQGRAGQGRAGQGRAGHAPRVHCVLHRMRQHFFLSHGIHGHCCASLFVVERNIPCIIQCYQQTIVCTAEFAFNMDCASRPCSSTRLLCARKVLAQPIAHSTCMSDTCAVLSGPRCFSNFLAFITCDHVTLCHHLQMHDTS